MNRLPAIMVRTISEQGLFEGCGHLLAGVSGGADSVAMACALASLRERFPLKITLAHLNHGIRGEDAASDETFVRELAGTLGYPCLTEQRDVPALASAGGVSLEMAAREARHDFFRRCILETGADAVALAHTVDDQVETILLRMFRGCGLLGLAGIPYVTEIPGLRIVRPLRDASREDVIRFLLERGREWREDESNQDPGFMRNRVRHEVLPLLEERLNPRVRTALLRMADIARADNEWMDAAAGKALSNCLLRGKELALNAGRLGSLPMAEQRRVIMKWLAGQRVDQRLLDAETIERIGRLTLGINGTKTVPLRAGWQVSRVYDELVLQRKSGGHHPGAYRLELSVPGETDAPELPCRVQVERGCGIIRQRDALIGRFPLAASLNAEVAGDAPLFVRTWRFGDFFRPLGLQGGQKVQDIFVNAKTPRACRATWPLIECRGQLVWIPGYRIAQGWELPDEQAAAVHITLLPKEPAEG